MNLSATVNEIFLARRRNFSFRARFAWKFRARIFLHERNAPHEVLLLMRLRE